jgi:REP element-mobilizing transposase RayT
MRRARARQAEIEFRTHGGKRRGAGRKPAGEHAGVSHRARPALSGREPVLVTLKVRAHVWNLRTERAMERLEKAFLAARDRFGMRIVHYSVQRDHIHLGVEAEDARSLSRGMQGLCVRIARALNAMMGTRGPVFADRYHAHVLRTPTETRNGIAYLLLNGRKHGHAPRTRGWLDPFSSARAFDGWKERVEAHRCARASERPPPVCAPRTWLLTVGWRRAGGSLDPEHRPGPWDRETRADADRSPRQGTAGTGSQAHAPSASPTSFHARQTSRAPARLWACTTSRSPSGSAQS